MTHFSIRRWTRSLLAVVALLPATGTLGAGWDEAIDGDLSGDYQNPTVVELAPGVNTLRATSGSSTALDVEYFRIDLEAGWQLDAIILRDFVSAFDAVAFIGVQEGTSFTFPANEAFTRSGELLGWAHFGPFEDDDFDAIGKDFLPQMGTNGPIGFSGPLTGPSYTFWAQQQGESITYELDFVVSAVIPEPATAVAAISAIVLAAFGRRRQG